MNNHPINARLRIAVRNLLHAHRHGTGMEGWHKLVANAESALNDEKPESARNAAFTLLRWIDELDDPDALATAIAQADEALVKAHDSSGDLDAAKLAFVRRFVESIALNNSELLRMLTKGTGHG